MNASMLAVIDDSGLAIAALDVIVKSTLLLAVAAIVTLLLRRSSAAIRHRIWSLAICGLFVLPVLSGALPGWKLPILPRETGEQQPSLAVAETSVDHGDIAAGAIETPPNEEWAIDEPPRNGEPTLLLPITEGMVFPFEPRSPIETPQTAETNVVVAPLDEPVAPSGEPDVLTNDRVEPAQLAAGVIEEQPRRFDPVLITFACWAIVAMFLLARLVLGLWHHHRQRGRARAMVDEAWLTLLRGLRERMKLRRNVALLQADGLGVPVACGLLRPAIWLPADANAWPDDLRRTVLMHELAHIQRHDVAWQLTAQLACCFHWFNPLAWHARRQLRLTREMACDDLVLAQGEPPADYAARLVQIAKQYRPARHSAVVAMAQVKSLELRVRSLFDATRSHWPLGRGASRALLIIALGLSSAIAAIRPTARGEEPAVALAVDDSATEETDADVVDESSAVDAVTESTSDSTAPPQQRIAGVVLDEAGNPVAGVTVYSLSAWAETTESGDAVTDVEGRFTVSKHETNVIHCAHDSRLGFFASRNPRFEGPVEITLKPPRSISIGATLRGEPAEGAIVEVQSNFFPVATGTTDAGGHCEVSIPRDAVIHNIIVLKPDVGFGCWQSEPMHAVVDNSPDEFALELVPTTSINVRVEDQHNRPVEGIEVTSWLIEFPGWDAPFNFGATENFRQTTNAAGEATFQCFPETAYAVSLSPRESDGYHTGTRAEWRSETGNFVTLPVWTLSTVTGTVFDTASSPAAGVQLHIEGRGPHSSSVKLTAVTDDQGRYEVQLPPYHAYSITVVDDDRAGRTLSGFIVPDEGRLDGLDLQLVHGTVFHGVVRTPDGRPTSQLSMRIEEDLDLQSIIFEGHQKLYSPMFYRSLEVDDTGSFSIILAPGTYDVTCYGRGRDNRDWFQFTVADQAEITHDFVIAEPEAEEPETEESAGIVARNSITGRVVRDVNGTLEPVSGATLTALPITHGLFPFSTVSDEAGAFSVERQPGERLLLAVSEDGAWGAAQIIERSSEALEIVLLPTTSATGQIVEAGIPLAGFAFNFDISIDHQNGTGASYFRKSIETDHNGRFTLPNLVQGQAYRCSHTMRGTSYGMAVVTVPDAIPVDLGQIEHRREYREETYLEHLQEAFRHSNDIRRGLDGALFDADLLDKHVLVIAGDPNSKDVEDVFRLLFKDEGPFSSDPTALRPRLRHFAVCGVAPRHVTDMQLGEVVTVTAAGPTLLVLNSDWDVLGQLPADAFVGDDGNLDQSIIARFLDDHGPDTRDAMQVLEETVAEARASDPPRIVVIHEVDTFLPLSRRVSLLFSRHRDALEPHFVYLPLDRLRMDRGSELLEELTVEMREQQFDREQTRHWIGLMTVESELLGWTTFTGHTEQFQPADVERFADLLHEHAPEISVEEIISWLDPSANTQAAVDQEEASEGEVASAANVTGMVVDETGTAVAGVEVEYEASAMENATVMTDDEGRFYITASEGYGNLVARVADGSVLGYLRVEELEAAGDLQIVLKPPRIIDVTASMNGSAVADASVEVHVRYDTIAIGITDAEGRCRLAMPQDGIIQNVIVFKQDVGFAGIQQPRDYALEVDESPDVYDFELLPATRINVRVHDHERQPVSDLRVYPFLVQMPGNPETINLSGGENLWASTDADGIATFNVFPAAAQSVMFGVARDDQHHPLLHPTWQPGGENTLTIEVWPFVTVAGTVIGIDGQPAAGVPLRMTATGPDDFPYQSYVHGELITDETGQYELRVPIDHSVMIGVDDPGIAAETLLVVSPTDVDRLDGQDMRLVSGTRFHGTVLRSDGTPLNDEGLMISERADPRRIMVSGQSMEIEPRFSRDARIDAEGRFSIMLGPGRYLADYSGQSSVQRDRPTYIEFEITDQTEFQHDWVFDVIPTEPLIGRVLRVVDGQLEPVVGITVTGIEIDGRSRDSALSNENGEFQIPWDGSRLILHAVTADGEWGITQLVDGPTDEVEDMILLPTVSASGQILEEGGPLAEFRIEYMLTIEQERNSPPQGMFNAHVVTDEAGRFTIDGLIQGRTYHSTHWAAGSGNPLLMIVIEDGTPIDLGEVHFDSNSRERTPGERIREAFLGGDDPRQHLETACEDAAFQRQHVLAIVGNPASDQVRSLFRLIFLSNDPWEIRDDVTLRRRLRHYELCGFDPSQAGDSGHHAIAAAGAGDGVTLIALDATGALLGTLSEEQFLTDDGTLRNSAIEDFLHAHRPPDIDANLLLEVAQSEAAASDPPRLILLHKVDMSLGKSRCLSRFFMEHSDTLGEHLVYLPLDPERILQGYDPFMAATGDEFRSEGGYSSGTWIGLLTADGEYLGSTRIEGHLPELSQEDVDEFINLLMEHAPQISEQELGAWLDDLRETPAYGPR